MLGDFLHSLEFSCKAVNLSIKVFLNILSLFRVTCGERGV
jgi:hypothetical protein